MWLYAFILLFCLSRHQCAGNTADCLKKEKSFGVLDLAKDSINKAKDLFPNCIDDNNSTNATGCGKKEKALAFLEIASNLINEAKRNYPTCTETEPIDPAENPEPTETPEPTGTPEPTRTPKPTGTPEPMRTPKPTGTPEPTRTPRPLIFGTPKDCTDVLHNGYTRSGVYEIWPNSSIFHNRPINVYCDMDTNGGGWTVIQRRGDFGVSQDFYQDWANYKRGFGDLRGEFWLGNDNISAISNQGRYAVRFDLEDYEGNKRFANYSSFRIENESALYRLHISGYSGNAGDSMGYDDNNTFCTRDRNNGKIINGVPCVTSRKSAWWMDSCNKANLNGVRQKGAKSDTTNMYWKEWKVFEGLAAAEIKLRRTD